MCIVSTLAGFAIHFMEFVILLLRMFDIRFTQQNIMSRLIIHVMIIENCKSPTDEYSVSCANYSILEHQLYVAIANRAQNVDNLFLVSHSLIAFFPHGYLQRLWVLNDLTLKDKTVALWNCLLVTQKALFQSSPGIRMARNMCYLLNTQVSLYF